MTQPPCKKCLLSEIDGSEVFEKIRNMIALLPEREKADDKEYSHRLELCKECDALNAGTCMECGCYVELRAAKKDGSCPIKRWR